MLKACKTALALALVAAAPVSAAVVTNSLQLDFGSTPYTFDFGGGSTVTFTLVDPSFFALNPTGVSTTGSTQVLSLGAPFYNPPQPTSFFSNRGGSIGPSTLGQFASYTSPAAVAYSITDSIIGLRFDLGQGFQYGYAEVAGSHLYGVRYETTPGASVAIAPVPEPATWALMITGFGLVGVSLRRSKGAVTA